MIIKNIKFHITWILFLVIALLVGSSVYARTGSQHSGFNTQSLDLEAGSTECVSITDAAQTGLDLLDDFTFTAWVRMESLPTFSTIIGKWNTTSNNRQFAWRLDHGVPEMQLDVSGGASVSSAQWAFTFEIEPWYHLAVAFDDSADTADAWIDGVKQTQITGLGENITDDNGDFQIGSQDNGCSNNYWDGELHAVRVYSRLLSESEIRGNMFRTAPSDVTGLQGEWNFSGIVSDNSVERLKDESVNGNNLSEGCTDTNCTFINEVPFSPILFNL